MNEPDICANRHRGTRESVEAHQKTLPNKLRDRAKIIEYLKDTGAHTAEEIELALDMRRSTVSARMSELKRDSLIEKVGRRPTTTGATAGVYDVTWNQELFT